MLKTVVDITECKDYTTRKLRVSPARTKSDRYKPKPKKKSAAVAANFDLFDLNKRINPLGGLPLHKRLKQAVSESILSSGPVYIGQNVYVRPSYVVSLPEYIDVSRNRSQAAIDNEKNLTDNKHGGTLSNKAINKMKNAINWMLCQAKQKDVYHKEMDRWFKFKVNFITLTLPDTAQTINDEDFKTKLVGPFLAYMRKYYKLNHYVWKLEFQGNGKLHLHLVTDTFIHWQKIRKSWNTILGHNNYLTDFYKKFGHADPNSTDVHSVKKIRDLAGYLCKYMSKQSADLAKVKGRIWGCSEALSRANTTRVFIDRDACHTMLKPLLNSRLEYRAIMGKNKKTLTDKKIGEIIFLKYTDWLTIMQGTVKETFIDTISFLQNTSGNELLRYEV